MQTLKLKTITTALVAGLALASGVHAQMGPMNGMSQKGGPGGGMMGGGMMRM